MFLLCENRHNTLLTRINLGLQLSQQLWLTYLQTQVITHKISLVNEQLPVHRGALPQEKAISTNDDYNKKSPQNQCYRILFTTRHLSSFAIMSHQKMTAKKARADTRADGDDGTRTHDKGGISSPPSLLATPPFFSRSLRDALSRHNREADIISPNDCVCNCGPLFPRRPYPSHERSIRRVTGPTSPSSSTENL